MRRRGRLRGLSGLISAITLVGGVLVIGASGVFAVTGQPSNFESGDGNMVLDTAGNTDWNCFANNGASSNGFGQSGVVVQPPSSTSTSNCKVTSASLPAGASVTNFQADSTSSGEVVWTPGQKFDNATPTYITKSSTPPKDDYLTIAQYLEVDSSGTIWFDGGAIRSTNNGNASGDVEFDHGNSGPGTSYTRQAGDKLIAYDFLGGGAGLNLHVLTWTLAPLPSGVSCAKSSDHAPCWVDSGAPPSGDFDGNSNPNAIPAAQNGMSGIDLGVNQFSEFGANLTAILGLGTGCNPLGTQIWESRSSGSSFTSNPEDIETFHQQVHNCGTITVIKHTLDGSGNRSGVDQSFSYDTTGGLTPSTFSLNDSSGTDGASNTQSYTSVPKGSYTVTEGKEPPNFTLVSVTCTSTGTGTSTSTASGSPTASITLAGGGNVICTYVNQQQLGAIRINKTSSKAAATPLSGAQFFLCTNNTNVIASCTAAKDASGTTVTNPLSTDSNGTVCQANLPFGNYFVFESAAPTGYAIDDKTAHAAAVSSEGDCSSSTSQSVTLSFTDTPLTDITATASSEATGGTKSTITCTNSSSANVGNSPQGPTANPSVSATGLLPGTYTCTIVIDP